MSPPDCSVVLRTGYVVRTIGPRSKNEGSEYFLKKPDQPFSKRSAGGVRTRPIEGSMEQNKITH